MTPRNLRFDGVRVLLAACFVVASATPLRASPGDLDTTFSGDGKVTTPVGTGSDTGQGVVVQTDGKIVVAGYQNSPSNQFAVVRYNDDGTLDTDFDGDGIVTTSIGASAYGYAVALQTDGRIVVAGYGGATYLSDFAVARYNDDGSLDTMFDGDGIVTTPIGSGLDVAYAVAIQGDGKIVVAGEAVGASDVDVAVVRYNDDGSLDTTFGGGDGIVITPVPIGIVGPPNDSARGIAIDESTGKIIVAGRQSTSFSIAYMFVIRYDDAGNLDTTFDGDGIRKDNLSGNPDGFSSITLQGDGKILAGGIYNAPGGPQFVVGRYDDDGTPDTAFDTDGFATTDVTSPGIDQVFALGVQADGKILAAGQVGSFGTFDFGLVRYDDDGTLDTAFGTAGIVTTSFGAGNDVANGLALAPGNKVLLAGFGDVSGVTDIALARYDLGPLGPTPTPTPALTATPTATATPLCPISPIAPCRTPSIGQKAFLQLKDKTDDTKDGLQWKWLRGSVTTKSDFSNPTGSTNYRLCIYAGPGLTPPVIVDARIPAGGQCNASNPVDCWKDKPKGYNYKDKDRTPDGIEALILGQGLDPGKAKIILKGKGSLLDDPTYPIAQPVRVQLSNDNGFCWEAVYSSPALKNTDAVPFEFKDKAD